MPDPIYTGVIQDKGGAVYNLRGYGAVGDGVTDDTNAIVAAIAAVPDGGTLYIPTGTFRITDTIHINRAISIEGSGSGSAIWLDLNSTTKTGIVIGLLLPITGVVDSVAQNQTYRNFGIFGPTGSCKYGLGVFHSHRARFENVHVRPGSSHHAVVVGGCLLTHFNFIIQNNALYGYPAGTGVWGGAGILIADLRTFTGSGSTMPTNACVFDCIVEGAGAGGLATQPQAQSGGNNFITGTYEGFTVAPVVGSVYGTGYGLRIEGCSGFDLYDLHVEADTEGTLIRNSSGFTVRQSGFYSWTDSNNQPRVERLKIENSSNFRVERISVGLLQIEPSCSQYDVNGVVGSKDVYSVARKQDSFYIGGPDPIQSGIAWGAGMAPFTTENLVPNGDLSRTPHGFAYAGVPPTLVRTGVGQDDLTRRFNRYGLKISGGEASGFSTRAHLVVPISDSLLYLDQPVTIWADIKHKSGPDLLFGVFESIPGRYRTLVAVSQNETGWVRVAATHYPSTTNGAWGIFISPQTDAEYTYYLGGIGALVGVAAPMGVGSPAPSFQDGLQLTGKRMEYGDGAPTTGTWQPGDIVFDASPSAGGTVGWVCTAAGTPGTWKTFGAISS